MTVIERLNDHNADKNHSLAPQTTEHYLANPVDINVFFLTFFCSSQPRFLSLTTTESEKLPGSHSF